MATPVANPDDHPLLTARHVDDLTSAVRMLTRSIGELMELQRKQVVAIRDLTRAIGGADAVTRDTKRDMPAITLESPDGQKPKPKCTCAGNHRTTNVTCPLFKAANGA